MSKTYREQRAFQKDSNQDLPSDGQRPSARSSRYLPPIELVLRVLGAGPALPEGNRPITVNSDGLRAVLRWLVRDTMVDEEWYARNYPDVAQAKSSGRVSSCKSHFIEAGYFEGRQDHPAEVDEGWYLVRYPDVEDAIRAGLVESATAHYNGAGRAEGRAPSREHQRDSEYWVEAAHRVHASRAFGAAGSRGA